MVWEAKSFGAAFLVEDGLAFDMSLSQNKGLCRVSSCLMCFWINAPQEVQAADVWAGFKHTLSPMLMANTLSLQLCMCQSLRRGLHGLLQCGVCIHPKGRSRVSGLE